MAAGFDLLVLDEAIGAMAGGMIGPEALCDFIKNRPESLELVLTGRGDIGPLRGQCDYITEMRAVAHPFESCGAQPREGIEF